MCVCIVNLFSPFPKKILNVSVLLKNHGFYKAAGTVKKRIQPLL